MLAEVGMTHIYLFMVDELLADLSWVESVQTAAAFSCPGRVLGLEAVVDEAPLNTLREQNKNNQ